VPILAGGRLTGRAGGYTIGLLSLQTQDEPTIGAESTNFSVVRVKRDLLRRSSIGAIFTNRSVGQTQPGSNAVYGVDGTFVFHQNLYLNTYWAKSQTDGIERDDVSYRAQLEYAGDRYGVQIERLRVGDNFNPDVGFVRRDDLRQSYAQFRFSPRPATIKSVRKFSSTGTVNYIEDGAGRLETREVDGEFAVELQNSDRLNIGFTDSFELLQQPFAITPNVRIPVGGYDFAWGRIGYNFGQQRAFSGNLSVEHGTFYDGHRTTVGFSRPRVNLTPQASVEPSVSINWVDLPYGSFTTKLIGSRVTYTLTPQVFASALVQYNSSINRVSTNVRLRWEYQPGSELFVVYNDERDSLSPGFPSLQNRALIIKVNRLFRF
jgi:hypothetical protein